MSSIDDKNPQKRPIGSVEYSDSGSGGEEANYGLLSTQSFAITSACFKTVSVAIFCMSGG